MLADVNVANDCTFVCQLVCVTLTLCGYEMWEIGMRTSNGSYGTNISYWLANFSQLVVPGRGERNENNQKTFAPESFRPG